MWFDFGLEDIPDEYKRRMASYYYSKEDEWDKEVIITRKGEHLPDGVGVLDIERGKMEGPAPYLWQTDDSISVRSWSWVVEDNFKSTEELIHELIDIVSKNGILLLNVCPKTDGTFTQDQKESCCMQSATGWKLTVKPFTPRGPGQFMGKGRTCWMRDEDSNMTR
ncbi:MAG: alpha-L-fucosidase [Planctomycetota bacterium]